MCQTEVEVLSYVRLSYVGGFIIGKRGIVICKQCLDTFVLAVKKKVKVTLVQVLRLCTGRTAHRGSRGIALLFHDQRH